MSLFFSLFLVLRSQIGGGGGGSFANSSSCKDCNLKREMQSYPRNKNVKIVNKQIGLETSLKQTKLIC